MRPKASFFLLPLLVLVARYSVSTSTCYFPDGTPAKDTQCQDVPHSGCCAARDTCLSNGLCFTENLRLVRGSCTDITWRAPECPNFCTQNREDYSIELIWCGDMLFTCNGQNCLDSNFTLSVAQIVLRGNVESSSMTLYTTSASNFVGATPNPSTTSTTPASFSTLSATCLPSITCPLSTTCPTLESDATSTANNCTQRLTQNSKVVAVGAGVGVPLAITVLVVVALFTWNQRLRKELQGRTITTEDRTYMGQTWINQEEPTPQNFDLQEMPSGRPFPAKLMGRRI